MLAPLLLIALAQAAAPVPEGPFTLLDRIAAVVGDDVILETEVERMATVELLVRRTGEDDAAFRDRILEERIDEVLEEQQLRRSGGLEPDPRDVEAKVKELADRLARAPGGTLEERMARAGVTRQDVNGWIRRGLMLSSYVRERISPTIKTTDAELRAFYEGPFRAEARGLGHDALPPFAEVQDQLRELVRERKLNEAVGQWVRDLREAARVVIYRRPGRPGSSLPASR